MNKRQRKKALKKEYVMTNRQMKKNAAIIKSFEIRYRRFWGQIFRENSTFIKEYLNGKMFEGVSV